MELADVMQGTGKNKKNGNIFERWKYVPIRSAYPLLILLGFIRTVHQNIIFKRNRSVMCACVYSGASTAKDLGSRAAPAAANKASHPSREGRDDTDVSRQASMR